MKKLLIVLVILCLMALLTNAAITYPNGFENITSQDINITWEEVTGNDTYNLGYSDNSGLTYTNISNINNATSYLWDISSLLEGDGYRVRVQACDGVNCTVWDSSDDDFSIVRSPYTPIINLPQATTYTTKNLVLTAIINCSGIDPNGDNLTFYLFYDNNLEQTLHSVSGGSVQYNKTIGANGEHTVICQTFDGAYTSTANATTWFKVVLPYTAVDIPNIFVDFFADIPVQFKVMKAHQLILTGLMITVLGIGVVGGIKTLIEKVRK